MTQSCPSKGDSSLESGSDESTNPELITVSEFPHPWVDYVTCRTSLTLLTAKPSRPARVSIASDIMSRISH